MEQFEVSALDNVFGKQEHGCVRCCTGGDKHVSVSQKKVREHGAGVGKQNKRRTCSFQGMVEVLVVVIDFGCYCRRITGTGS